MNARNTLIIMTDELSREGVSCYGGVASTPNIDRLAQQGTRFTTAYTPSPVCVPTRAAFQSGHYVFRNRCWSNAQPYAGSPRGWAHQLKANGHNTVSIGKLHYRSSDDDNGFSREIVPLHVLDGEGWVFGLLRRQDHTAFATAHFADEIGPGEDAYSTYDRTVRDQAVAWLNSEGRSTSDKPWSLLVSFLRPHYPLTCPKAYYDLYDPRRIPEPRYGGYRQEFRHPVLNAFRSYYDYDDHLDVRSRQVARASYFGLCSFVDALIGDVLGALEASGRDKDTVVLFTSDHGELNGHHGLWTKMTMHEESVGIPLILSGAGIPRGACDTQASLVDIHPTVLEIAGLNPPQDETDRQGRSLLQLANAPQDPNRTVFSEYHDGGSITGYMMIREGRHKYIAYPGFASQLFDLESDPYEMNDLGLTAGHASIRRHLHHRMTTEFADPDVINTQAFSDQAERIEALGGVASIRARENFDFTPV